MREIARRTLPGNSIQTGEEGAATPPGGAIIWRANPSGYLLAIHPGARQMRANARPACCGNSREKVNFDRRGDVEKVPFFGDRGDAPLDLKSNPPYPPLSGGYKKAMRPRRVDGALLFLAPLTRGGRGGCSLDNGFFNYPLRVWLSEGKARRRGRAFCAKADSVGGKMRYIATPNYTPHQLACGLRPCLVVGLPEEERPTLKGGVNFKTIEGSLPTEKGFFNSSEEGGGDPQAAAPLAVAAGRLLPAAGMKRTGGGVSRALLAKVKPDWRQAVAGRDLEDAPTGTRRDARE